MNKIFILKSSYPEVPLTSFNKYNYGSIDDSDSPLMALKWYLKGLFFGNWLIGICVYIRMVQDGQYGLTDV